MKHVMKLLALSALIALPVYGIELATEANSEVVVADPVTKPVQKRLGKTAKKAAVIISSVAGAAVAISVGYACNVHGKVGQWWNRKPVEIATVSNDADRAPVAAPAPAPVVATASAAITPAPAVTQTQVSPPAGAVLQTEAEKAAFKERGDAAIKAGFDWVNRLLDRAAKPA